MKIKRIIDGKEVVIELTHDELATAYNQYEHHCDCEYVRNCLVSGCYEEFESLSDEAREEAVNAIAYEKRKQQDEHLVDEDYALNIAIEWYIENHLQEEA